MQFYFYIVIAGVWMFLSICLFSYAVLGADSAGPLVDNTKYVLCSVVSGIGIFYSILLLLSALDHLESRNAPYVSRVTRDGIEYQFNANGPKGKGWYWGDGKSSGFMSEEVFDYTSSHPLPKTAVGRNVEYHVTGNNWTAVGFKPRQSNSTGAFYGDGYEAHLLSNAKNVHPYSQTHPFGTSAKRFNTMGSADGTIISRP